MQLGTGYDEDAECPRWIQFLNEVFNEDAELIDYIQRAIGYCLTGDTREQSLFLCYGNGANGKSVFLDMIARLLGDYSGTASFETFDANRHNTSASNDLAALNGKRFVSVIETAEDRFLDEARVKQVTGQDVIACRFLYSEFFEYRPQFKIWMAMNHKPVIKGTDRGIWRRIVLVPFTQSFEGREDRTLGAKLQGELPGILNWAIEGLGKWRNAGLSENMPQAVKGATEEYRQECDLIGQWLEERTTTNPDATVTAMVLYNNYKNWIEIHGGHAVSTTKWGSSMKNDRGFKSEKRRDGMFYLGLALKELAF